MEPKVGSWQWWKENRDTPVVEGKPPQRVAPRILQRMGYVYYCGDGNGRVKIGFSKNPWSRCKEMRCFNPDVKLLTVERGTQELEKARQKEFQKYHLVFEWFKNEGELSSFISGLGLRHELAKRGEISLEDFSRTQIYGTDR